MTHFPALLPIVPTRVRRGYRGGKLLDLLSGAPSPVDNDKPEDWLASTVEARNPGLPDVALEGLTRVRLPDGKEALMRDLLSAAPEVYLGKHYTASRGTSLSFIAKLLDAANRLHVQAHPTSAFARERLAAPFGKLEVYYVLEVRPGFEGTLRLGFQHPPSREEWKRIVLEQDIPAMDACFEPVPIKPGEVWIVPGGVPHAIGGGVLLIEVMEPSDLVVRCEFERDGVVVPPGGRFMGKDIELCLDIFDYTAYPLDEVAKRFRLTPEPAAPGSRLEKLVGASRTSCFELYRACFKAETDVLALGNEPTLLIQTKGSSTLSFGDQAVPLVKGQACFVGASAGQVTVASTEDSELLAAKAIPEPA